MFGIFGKSESKPTIERLMELIQKFEIQGTPSETKPQSNSIASAAARGFATTEYAPEAEEYFKLKNKFAVDLLTHRAKYNIPQDKAQYFFTEVAQQTKNGDDFMKEKRYTTFMDVPQQIGGRRRTRKSRRKHKSKRV